MYSDGEDVEPLRNQSTERLLKLVLLLQSSKRGFKRSDIFEKISEYDESNEAACLRMFERDKRALLSIGILIEGRQLSELFPDDFFYRIRPENSQLPEITFSEGERMALSAALDAWRDSAESKEANEARYKLEALGIDLPEQSSSIAIGPDADIDDLLDAIAQRRTVKFTYRKPESSEALDRRLQGWGLACRSGNFFVYGFDVDRKAVRAFNLSRVVSGFTAIGEGDSYEIPRDIDVDELLHLGRLEPAVVAKLQIAEGKGGFWRQLAGSPEALSMTAGTFDVPLRTPYSMIPQLAGDAPGVIVLGPEEVRSKVMKLLGVQHGTA